MRLEELQTIWSDNTYYPMAEEYMHTQWDSFIWPRIKDCDFSYIVDLACGHGRNSQKLIIHARHLVLVDICMKNLDICQSRFSFLSGIEYLLCDGESIPTPADTASLVYCWDAMVHFEPEAVAKYLQDTYRTLKSGGIGFFHHSNYSGIQCTDWRYNPHARNQMTQELFCQSAIDAGLRIISSDIMDWCGCSGLDCVTVVKK